MKMFDILAAILLVIGGLNWGLWGAMHMDLVAKLLGDYTMPARIVYGLVGVAAVYQVIFLKSIQSRWGVCK